MVATSGRVRLDQLLVDRGLSATRSEAARLIMAGRVRLSGRRAGKAGQLLRADTGVELASVTSFVGRGGDKLAAALDAFSVLPRGRGCLDVGASTGGFTDCLLQREAARVYAVDVGKGQLHPRVRGEARVVVLEGVNARRLDVAQLGERPSLATVDVSFISLAKVLPAVMACLDAEAELVVLVKPQFEVGAGLVGRGGVVRDAARHRDTIAAVAAVARRLGAAAVGVVPSPLRGPKGNREFFLYLRRGGPSEDGRLEAAIEAAVASRP